MRVTLKTVNGKLAELGANAELAKGMGYFFFRGGEADGWIDRTVAVPAIGSLTLEEWLKEYQRLKTLNGDMFKAAKNTGRKPAPKDKGRAATSAQVTLREKSTPAARTDRVSAGGLHRVQQGLQSRRASTLSATHKAPPHEPKLPEPSNEPRALKDRLLADVEDAYKTLLDIEKKQTGAARAGGIADLVTLAAAASKQRGIFDRALVAVREHALLHGCFPKE